MEKHTAYYNLLEQLSKSGCPLCRQRSQSLHHFLDTYLYEGVNDRGNWEKLTASGGWCENHARQLRGFSDGLAVALFYRHVIRKRMGGLGTRPEVKGKLFGRRAVPPCPACVYQGEVDRLQVQIFLQCVSEAEFRKAFQNRSTLCLPHTEAVCRQASAVERAPLIELLRAPLEALCDELDLIVKRHDYRNVEKMGPEGDAWKRALATVYGWE